MPKHISETLLSACGCHTALAIHANICQVIVQTEDSVPSQIESIGLDDSVSGNEAVFCC